MERVEKRKHRGLKHRRTWWLLTAVCLLAACAAAFFLWPRTAPEELPEREEHGGVLVQRDVSELVSLSVQRRNGESWTLRRNENGQLEPEGEEGWVVESAQGDLLQEAMTSLSYEEILTEDPAVWQESPEDFGLAEPLVSATALYTDGQSFTVHIGNRIDPEEGLYYMTVEGDERLYAVAAGTAEDLNVEYSLLHPTPKLEIYAALLDRITVLDENGNKTAEWSLAGRITDRDAGTSWLVTVPFLYPVDVDSIKNLKKNAEDLRLGVYTGRATEENLERYGLKTPRQTLVFHMSEGSTGTVGDAGIFDVADHEERTVTLEIGDADDELASYIRYEDGIFLVSHFTVGVFADTDPAGTVARYPVLTPLASLEKLTIEGKEETVVYTVEHTGENDPETAEEKILCRRNGEEIPYEMFEAAYERLLVVTFSGTLPQEAEWKEPYQKYTFHTLSGGTHTICLCDWDGMHDAVTVDGYTRLYLIKGGMPDFPIPEQ